MHSLWPHIAYSVVVLVLDNTIRHILNRAEVTLLFSHPFASLLCETNPFATSIPNVIDQGNSVSSDTSRIGEPDGNRGSVSNGYHTFLDIKDWAVPGAQVRMHRFLTGREADGTKPIFGLTAYAFYVCPNGSSTD